MDRTGDVNLLKAASGERRRLYQFCSRFSVGRASRSTIRSSIFDTSSASMIQTTTQTAPMTLKAVSGCPMKIDGSETQYGDWRDDLARDGYVVVKGAIPREKADDYADRMYTWLEGLWVAMTRMIRSVVRLTCWNSNLGFDRNDLSTVHRDRLPTINEKGMCLNYAVTHEDFAWGVRGEPGVVEAFEKIYDDKDLIVSFDAINFTFPK
jgi:hypothetical protein